MESREDREKYERLAQAHATWRALSDVERDRWLFELERDDPALARELHDLVSAASAGEALFADATIEERGGLPHAGLVPPKQEEELPETIGTYRVLRRLGSGGMGVVYEAEQESPRRRVALKVIHAELAHGTRLRRFQHEAEAQGRLRHPGIGRPQARWRARSVS